VRVGIFDMRLWTLHPRYLDSRGLVALWREGLLAQKVLQGRTRGYRHHPQLHRFRSAPDPLRAIATYLAAVLDESVRRGYSFDAGKLPDLRMNDSLTETRGQISFEWDHLRRKLARRDPVCLARLSSVRRPSPHPLFRLVAGDVRDWERAGPE
jgi:hypothetical protein